MTTDKLLELLDKATDEDIGEIDSQIKDIETRLDALRSLRRVISVRVNGKTPRKQQAPRQPKESAAPASGGSASNPADGGGNLTEQRIRQCAKYLLSAGSAKTSTLANHVGAAQGFHWVLKSPWFVVKGEYVQLSEEGKQAAAKL